MKFDRPRSPRSLLFLSTVIGASLATSCSSGNSTPADETVATPAQIAALRAELTAAEITPLPSPPTVSAELMALGQALYFDKALSGNMDTACSTCHLAAFGGADGRALPAGVHGSGIGPARAGGDVVPRHSPSVLNSHLLPTSFWDGRVQHLPGGELGVPTGVPLPADMAAVLDPRFEVLAAQAMFPPTSREEMRGQDGENPIADVANGDMAGIWDALMERLLGFPEYAAMFSDAYPGTLLEDFNFAHVGNAIGAFEAVAFARTDSPFERFVNGDDLALTADEVRGALEFFGPGECSACHAGVAFTEGKHQNIGLPQFGPGKGDGGSTTDDFGRERVTTEVVDRYRFRTAPLLNVELTAPYGHLGQYPTLREMVAHYRDPATSLMTYDITEQVADSSLHASQLGNELDVLADLDARLAGVREFDTDGLVTFLLTLTADSARDLTDIVPATVPSGSTID